VCRGFHRLPHDRLAAGCPDPCNYVLMILGHCILVYAAGWTAAHEEGRPATPPGCHVFLSAPLLCPSLILVCFSRHQDKHGALRRGAQPKTIPPLCLIPNVVTISSDKEGRPPRDILSSQLE
jgi:hypothetical protein